MHLWKELSMMPWLFVRAKLGAWNAAEDGCCELTRIQRVKKHFSSYLCNSYFSDSETGNTCRQIRSIWKSTALEFSNITFFLSYTKSKDVIYGSFESDSVIVTLDCCERYSSQIKSIFPTWSEYYEHWGFFKDFKAICCIKLILSQPEFLKTFIEIFFF